jgi:hypothetical protein
MEIIGILIALPFLLLGYIISRRVIIFRDVHDLAWSLGGPTSLFCGLILFIVSNSLLVILLTVSISGFCFFVSLFITMRNNGIFLGIFIFFVKLALCVVVLGLCILAWGAAPVNSNKKKKKKVAWFPAVMAVGAVALFINGDRVGLYSDSIFLTHRFLNSIDTSS